MAEQIPPNKGIEVAKTENMRSRVIYAGRHLSAQLTRTNPSQIRSDLDDSMNEGERIAIARVVGSCDRDPFTTDLPDLMPVLDRGLTLGHMFGRILLEKQFYDRFSEEYISSLGNLAFSTELLCFEQAVALGVDISLFNIFAEIERTMPEFRNQDIKPDMQPTSRLFYAGARVGAYAARPAVIVMNASYITPSSTS